ncbi:hypothetical protein [Sorangium sp. So ce861]|uniref:hypothetical protein n=1 Tax=Sorangium sp. So ce861 TaxID=3133323 RepID=UPI003F62ABAA
MTLGLWKSYLQGVTKSIGDASNVILLGGILPAVLDQDLKVALAQVYQLGGYIPSWTMINPAGGVNTTALTVGTNALYQMYGDWLELILPAGNPTPDQLQQIQALQQEILKAKDSQTQIELDAYAQWKKLRKIPGTPPWQRYIAQEPWSTKLADAATAILGPQSQLDKLSEQAYGAGYQQLEQAKAVYAAANPYGANPNNSLQMTITQDGSNAQVPIYTTSDLGAYKQWLQQTKANAGNGVNPTVYISFSNDTYTSDSSFNTFAAGGTLPLEDFFWVGASGGETHQSLDLSQSSFQGTISYQDVALVTVQPGPWFDSSLVEAYANFSNFPPNTPFAGKQLWGPNGVFNIVVTGILVGYGAKASLQVSSWSSSDVKDAWSAATSIGFGPFTLGEVKDSGSHEKYKYKKTGSSINVYDETNQAKVIGLVVEALNYPPSGS